MNLKFNDLNKMLGLPIMPKSFEEIKEDYDEAALAKFLQEGWDELDEESADDEL